jgi:hypothetical protein
MNRFEQAIARFDAINSEDPKELIYSRRMTEWLGRLHPDAGEALRLAVAAQHIARWRIPRSNYPDGRSGYRSWRSELGRMHARIAAEVLGEVGYDPDTIQRVETMLTKSGLGTDPEVQALEDVACLVFLEHYLDDFASKHDDAKLTGILKKTWRKMSERGQTAALAIPMSPRARELVGKATSG